MNQRAPRVFFVDDEPEIRTVVERTLTQSGLDVTCFASAADCLKGKALDGCRLFPAGWQEQQTDRRHPSPL